MNKFIKVLLQLVFYLPMWFAACHVVDTYNSIYDINVCWIMVAGFITVSVGTAVSEILVDILDQMWSNRNEK